MIRVKYAHQEGIKIGFNRFNLSDDEKIEDMKDTFINTANNSRKNRKVQKNVRFTSELVAYND